MSAYTSAMDLAEGGADSGGDMSEPGNLVIATNASSADGGVTESDDGGADASANDPAVSNMTDGRITDSIEDLNTASAANTTSNSNIPTATRANTESSVDYMAANEALASQANSNSSSLSSNEINNPQRQHSTTDINNTGDLNDNIDGTSAPVTSGNMFAANSATVSLNDPQPATYHGAPRGVMHFGRKPAFGQSCSMKTLVQDGILQAGEKILTLEYEGAKFFGDLRKDGTIMMRGPDDSPHIYATPVAWANYCCKMLNPENKSLNAWSCIRFRGKRLDSYKLKWYRAQKRPVNNMNNNNNNTNNIVNNYLSSSNNASNNNGNNLNFNNMGSLVNNNPNNINSYLANTMNNFSNNISLNNNVVANFNNGNINTNGGLDSLASTKDDLPPNAVSNVINYEQLGTRGPHNTHSPNTMIKCIPFSAVNRIQPFNITVSTNALLLVDFHCHLVTGEAAGYLAGSWDNASHTLTVKQAFPCRTTITNEDTASSVEEEIRQDIEKRNLTVVGWYHSHKGKYSNHPTIKDIQSQIDHQITMKESACGYIPCIGLICSPHDTRAEDDLTPSFQFYWVMPPPGHLTNHYGRPMQMHYSVTRDLFLTQDLLLEMRLLANYYTSNLSEMVDFEATYEFNDKITNLEKLSGSIKQKLPKDLQESEYPDEPAIWKAAIDHFWMFLRNLVIPPFES